MSGPRRLGRQGLYSCRDSKCPIIGESTCRKTPIGGEVTQVPRRPECGITGRRGKRMLTQRMVRKGALSRGCACGLLAR